MWRTLIPQLSKTFFVINNLDQSSGLVNVSYSGNPERFVDCGRIVEHVKNLRGARDYDFPAASAQQSYETTDRGSLYGIVRTMALEGRVNIVLEEVSATVTRVTVNTRYVLTKHNVITDVMGHSQSNTETMNFGIGERGTFPAGTICQSTGALEAQILQLLAP